MPRRYLTRSEAESALNRGKAIECFLGQCERDGRKGIKWLSASRRGEAVRMAFYETADIGNEEFLDLYEFGPLNPDLDLDDPEEERVFGDFSTFISELESSFPGSTLKLVNEGVIQDEYLDYLARGRR